MTRNEAQSKVDAVAIDVNGMLGVPRSVVQCLLGQGRYDRLQEDRIRNLGPDPRHVYPWNVVDYLSEERG